MTLDFDYVIKYLLPKTSVRIWYGPSFFGHVGVDFFGSGGWGLWSGWIGVFLFGAVGVYFMY